MNSFERSINFTHRYLDALVFRQSVIADNIANVNTSNFKKSKVSFESELKKAIQDEKKDNIKLFKSSERHLNGIKKLSYLDVKPHLVLDHLSKFNNNGNNVDIDSEVKSLVQNQMIYDLITNIQNHFFKSVNILVK